MLDLDVVDLFTRPGTYVLGVGIFITVFMIRKIIESIWPRLKKQVDANNPKITYLTSIARWWNEVILYFLPVMIGIFCGFIRSDFLFSGIGDKGGKLIFGAVIGWFASFIYKLLRKVIKQKLGVDITPDVNTDEIDTPVN